MPSNDQPKGPAGSELATFGAGCFWCVEAVFQQLDGVLSVTPGYAGGATANPTYDDVCTGTTGHAEVCQIRYDPAKISYSVILEVFWLTHDPTTLNRQGHDVGPQYRSVIFCHSDEQKALAEQRKQELTAAGAFPAPVVTQIAPFTTFWPAETHHENYYRKNSEQPYCRFVIKPKLDKFRQVFPNKLRPAN
ncbi:MAG: peptide-methionine (S)-S-oxide reductase [Planctomycetes bacterium RBG_16_64_10]|nr:MAG: peptide-methionine (S)-S-oxide reductase [Planctomycetes bacterium RBG_16_64_10]